MGNVGKRWRGKRGVEDEEVRPASGSEEWGGVIFEESEEIKFIVPIFELRGLRG